VCYSLWYNAPTMLPAGLQHRECIILQAVTHSLVFDSVSKRNEYQEHFLRDKGGRWLGLMTVPPSCAHCLEIWEPQPRGNIWACNGHEQGLFYLYLLSLLLQWFLSHVYLCIYFKLFNKKQLNPDQKSQQRDSIV